MMHGNKPMKRLSLYLFLILFTPQTTSQADDIRDFEIEGMSIGDSLLDYFSEGEIKKFYRHDYPGSKKFFDLTIESGYSKLEVFDALLHGFKSGDKNYIIYNLGAALDFPNDIDSCLKKKNEITSELTELFAKLATSKSYSREHDQDKTGESKVYSTDFTFHTGEIARIVCIKWSDKFRKDNYIDHLRLFLSTNEYRKWINEEAWE